jgi:hypothetical protein
VAVLAWLDDVTAERVLAAAHITTRTRSGSLRCSGPTQLGQQCLRCDDPNTAM